MKLFVKILISVVVLILVIIVGGIIYLSSGLKDGANVPINEVKLSNFEDGVYEGQYEAGRWSNTLNITVENNRITKIDIVDDVTFSKPEVSDELFTNVINAQNTTVDAVTQATVTSKAYLKSIENALNKNE